VHLGTRFTASSRKAVFEDMVTQGIEVSDCGPLIHLQNFYSERGSRRGDCPVAEKTADRAVALPFSGAMTEENVDFVVQTLKDATINTGAGAAIYL